MCIKLSALETYKTWHGSNQIMQAKLGSSTWRNDIKLKTSQLPRNCKHYLPIRSIPTDKAENGVISTTSKLKASAVTTAEASLNGPEETRIATETVPVPPPTLKKPKRQADSTDAVATFLTRRFGLAGGLAWLGILAVGSIGEQVKTRMEVAEEEKAAKDVESAAEITTPSGLIIKDLRIGGGQYPQKGYLAVVDFVGKANGEVFEDTRARGKPIVLLYGSRPFTAGLCAGAEEALSGMKAGGRRIVKVPPQLGFGSAGAVLRPSNHVPDKSGIIPPDAMLEYDLELLRVSIPPS